MIDGLDAAIRAKLADRPWITADMGADAAGRANDWITGAHAALLAVLDLHPSVEDGASPVHCAHCGTREIHPCPTVRAIAKELGVEVGG